MGGPDPDEFIEIDIGKEFLTGGGDDGSGLGSQADAVVKGNTAAVLERSLATDGGAGDLDYLQELIAIQGRRRRTSGSSARATWGSSTSSSWRS